MIPIIPSGTPVSVAFQHNALAPVPVIVAWPGFGRAPHCTLETVGF